MKIVFIGGRDVHRLGGIESYMYNLSGTLAGLGHHPVVYCESDRNGTVYENGIKIVYQKGPLNSLMCKPLLGLVSTVRAMMTERDIDIIHYNTWSPSLSSWLPRLFGIKSLMMGHGLEWQRPRYSVCQQKIIRLMEGVTVCVNRHMIMCSRSQSRYFKERYDKDAPTIPTAVNMPAAEADVEVMAGVLARYSLQAGRYILFMGRLVQDKNPDYLIRAFKSLGAVGYKLVIAGDNESDPAYVKRLHELAEGERSIVFTGAVYGEEKDSLFRGAYAYCLPSSIEGLSISLLEAMSYRLPLIVSDIEPNHEILPAGNAVWVRPESVGELAEGLTYCMSHAGSVALKTEENYRIVKENYTWESVTQKYIAYLSSIGVK